MTYMRKSVVALFAALSLFLIPETSSAAENLKVVASIAPLADFARQVGGTRVEVTLLLPPGASPHTYEPPPRMSQEIAKSRVFIKIGAGLEFWADKMVSAAAPGILTVTCSEGVDLIRTDDHDHGHKGMRGVDPHIWLDPTISIMIIGKIENALSKTDPPNSAYYKKNASAYIAQLSALDREIAERVRTFTTKEYVTFHPAWNYFSRRYGLRVVGVIEESPGKEPTPKHLGRLLQTIRRLKTRVIFAEPQFSTRTAEAIAREAGAQVLILDPEGGQKGRETYLDLMRYNLSVMERAMK
jgi:zinc transport system substrate-binding protein